MPREECERRDRPKDSDGGEQIEKQEIRKGGECRREKNMESKKMRKAGECGKWERMEGR